MHHLMESVALLTKEIKIVTPLVLSIVVCVAPRLISYMNSQNRVVRSYHTRMKHHETVRLYRTWATVMGKRGRGNEAVRCICVRIVVQLNCNTAGCLTRILHIPQHPTALSPPPPPSLPSCPSLSLIALALAL